jgi:hypothetical protein
MIAEVSRKSFGLGIELGWANVFEVPIISLCINGNKLSNSVKFLSQEINMNQIIEVKLTDYGKEIMKKKHQYYITIALKMIILLLNYGNYFKLLVNVCIMVIPKCLL